MYMLTCNFISVCVCACVRACVRACVHMPYTPSGIHCVNPYLMLQWAIYCCFVYVYAPSTNAKSKTDAQHKSKISLYMQSS